MYVIPERKSIITSSNPISSSRCTIVMTDSLPRHELDQIASSLTQNGDDLFNENSTDKKEREVIHSNRVKLTDYVHDVTILFPYMKQHGVFNVYDCDVIKGE